jgi:hypothetical protein
VPAQLPGKVGEEVRRREKRSRQKWRKGKRERGRGKEEMENFVISVNERV